jgi:hypothetical protein
MGNKRRIGCLALSLAMGQASSLWAAAGTDSAAFLNIPVGAGPAAMGAAYTALATDAYAPTWNPAGLGFVPSTQVSAQHLSYLENVHYEYLSFVHPLKPGRAFGAAVQYLGSGDIPQTDINGNSTGNYSSNYAAYSLAYGQALGEKLSLGTTGKFITSKLSGVGANAYAFDAGSFYKLTETVNLAVVVANMGSKLTYLNEGGSLPLSVRFGGSAELLKAWTVSAEGVYLKEEAQTSGHFGLAWRPVPMISLRTGYRTDTLKGLDALAGFSTGIGVEMWGQEFSYAWVPYGDLGSTQYFSLVLKFGNSEEEKRNLIQYHTIKAHRSVQKSTTPADPDYQQLMQLLSESDRAFITHRPATEDNP